MGSIKREKMTQMVKKLRQKWDFSHRRFVISSV